MAPSAAKSHGFSLDRLRICVLDNLTASPPTRAVEFGYNVPSSGNGAIVTSTADPAVAFRARRMRMAYEAAEAQGLLAGGRLGETRHVFAFEAEFASDLRCIPMVVRFKLDRCGIKLSLRQWSRIGRTNRFALADRACDTPREANAYKAELLRLIDMYEAGEAVFLPVDNAPLWADTSAVPDRVATMIAASGLPPLDAATWAKLPTLQRFALLKLTRPGHDNENFIPAMREFGLAE